MKREDITGVNYVEDEGRIIVDFRFAGCALGSLHQKVKYQV
ncbi:hypothetical protein DOJK_00940 [Patescibacteria group bacterium]|nr:hypothetical protein DOJK_00940 [Patescibacteria group bacterium]